MMKKIKMFSMSWHWIFSLLILPVAFPCFADPSTGDLRVTGAFSHPEKGDFLFIQEFGAHLAEDERGFWSYEGGEGGIYWRAGENKALYKLHIEQSALNPNGFDSTLKISRSAVTVIHSPTVGGGTEKAVITIQSSRLWTRENSFLPRKQTINELELICPLEQRHCVKENKILLADTQKKLADSTVARAFKVFATEVGREIYFVFEDKESNDRFVIDRPSIPNGKGKYVARVWQVSGDTVTQIGQAEATDGTKDFLTHESTKKPIPLQPRGLGPNQRLVHKSSWGTAEKNHQQRIQTTGVYAIEHSGCSALLMPRPE